MNVSGTHRFVLRAFLPALLFWRGAGGLLPSTFWARSFPRG